MNEALKNRLLSFLWRLSAFLAVAALAFLTDNITDLTTSPFAIAIIGLMAGELTKWLNSKYAIGSKILGKK